MSFTVLQVLAKPLLNTMDAIRENMTVTIAMTRKATRSKPMLNLKNNRQEN